MERARPWILAAVTVACLLASVAVRNADRDAWTPPDGPYTAAGEPLVSTFDAYRWTRWAREEQGGRYRAGELDELRFHPRHRERPDPLPLPSRLLAWGARFTDGSVYRAGLVGVPWLASLFVVPVLLFGVRIGYPAAGVLGALTGAFASEYLARTGLGRIDTDCGMLLFPWLASLILLEVTREAGARRLVLLGVALAVTLALFQSWYGRAAFTAVYAGLGVARLATERVRLPRAALVGAAAIAVGGLALAHRELAAFAHAYLGLGGAASGDAAAVGPVMSTIREADALAPRAVLEAIYTPGWVAALGLVGFAGLLVARPHALVPLLPLIALGALSFVSGRRFMIFLAPLVGMGLGFVLTAGRRGHVLTAPLALAVFGVALLPLTRHDLRTRPALPAPVVEELVRLHERLPEGARVWTWWDTGYAVQDLTGAATFHDGGSQLTPHTYLVARGLLDPRPGALAAVASGLDRLDRFTLRRFWRRHPDPGEAYDALVAADARPEPGDRGLVVLFTADMIRKLGSMHAIATWSPEEGPGWVNGFVDHRCTSLRRDRVICDGGDVDLATGAIAGSDRRLRRISYVRGGRAVRVDEHDPSSPLSLDLFLDGRGRLFAGYLVDEAVYRSAFHRLFVLGEHDPRDMVEIVNAFPWLRAYRIRPRGFADGFESGDASRWSEHEGMEVSRPRS